jgi:hypothetical protein
MKLQLKGMLLIPGVNDESFKKFITNKPKYTKSNLYLYTKSNK